MSSCKNKNTCGRENNLHSRSDGMIINYNTDADTTYSQKAQSSFFSLSSRFLLFTY